MLWISDLEQAGQDKAPLTVKMPLTVGAAAPSASVAALGVPGLGGRAAEPPSPSRPGARQRARAAAGPGARLALGRGLGLASRLGHHDSGQCRSRSGRGGGAGPGVTVTVTARPAGAPGEVRLARARDAGSRCLATFT